MHRRLHPSTSRRDCCSAAAAALRAGPEPGSRLRPAPAGQRAREHRAALSSPPPLGGRAAAAGPSRLAPVSCQPAVSPGSAAPPPPLLPPPPLPHPRPPGEPPPPPRRDHRPRRLSSPHHRRRPPHATGLARLGPRRACSRPPQPPAHNPPRLRRGGRAAAGPGRGRRIGARLREGLARPPWSRCSLSGDDPARLPRASSGPPLRTALPLTLVPRPRLQKPSVAFRLHRRAGGSGPLTPRPPGPTDSQPPTPNRAQALASPYSSVPRSKQTWFGFHSMEKRKKSFTRLRVCLNFMKISFLFETIFAYK